MLVVGKTYFSFAYALREIGGYMSDFSVSEDVCVLLGKAHVDATRHNEDNIKERTKNVEVSLRNDCIESKVYEK